MPTASEVLGAFAAALRFRDLPDVVREKAKTHVLDVLGVALASSGMPFGRAAFDAVADSGAGRATVIGFSAPLSPAWAAFVNGTLAHGIDYDDTHLGSVVHVSCSVLPAALAVAETTSASGEEFLTALVVGLESAVRIGLAAPAAFHDRGFHPTGICGTFAATLTAGTLQRLTAAQLANALGLCGSLAAGSMEFLTDGAWSKRIHSGWAAHGGLIAARLAQNGFRGPPAVFEGRFGLYRSHLGDDGWDITAVARELSRRWEMLDIALKPYPCCHFNHAFIDCVGALRQQSGVTADTVARIECYVPPAAIPIVCEPVANKRVPQTDYDAKFSLPYAVAAALVRGRVDVDDFTDAAIRDPAALRVAAKVECLPDPNTTFPRHFPGRVRMTLTDGRVLEHHEPINHGSVDRPLSTAAVHDKFLRNAGRVLPIEQARALMAAVDGIERAPNVTELARLCTVSGTASARTVA